jgi:hypothetical protein
LYYIQANYLVQSGQQVPQDGDTVRSTALEVEELVKNTVAGALQIVSDVGTLAFSLEGGASPQRETALQEAQTILKVRTAVFSGCGSFMFTFCFDTDV